MLESSGLALWSGIRNRARVGSIGSTGFDYELIRVRIELRTSLMYLIEIFLPLADNDGHPFPDADREAVERELTGRFGGLTAYPRAPASGLWKESHSKVQQDDLVVYEVLSEALDVEWWGNYREKLEGIFRQEKLLIRSHKIQLL